MSEYSTTDLARLEEKLDELLSLAPALRALGDMLVEADYVTRSRGLNKKTISQNEQLEKFNEIGSRKLLMKLSSVPVVRNRKRNRNR